MKTKKFLGTLALGVAIGGAFQYFYNSATGKAHREKLQKLAMEVSDALAIGAGELKEIGQKEYDAVVDNIVAKYSAGDLLDAGAWLEIKKELKARWVDVQKELKRRR